MSVHVTRLANHIFEELLKLQVMLLGVIGDDHSHNRRLDELHEVKKSRALSDLSRRISSQLPAGANPNDFISYSGKSPAEANEEYSAFLEKALAEMVLCRAVDCYHWYLRQVILEILSRDPALVRQCAEELKIKKENEIASFERGEERDKLLIKWFRGQEKKSRDLIHEHWEMVPKNDLELLVKVRNCLVHQLGADTEGILEPALSSHPRLDVSVLRGNVAVNQESAFSAIRIVMADISIIDQCLARRFGLSTQPFTPESISRRYA